MPEAQECPVVALSAVHFELTLCCFSTIRKQLEELEVTTSLCIWCQCKKCHPLPKSLIKAPVTRFVCYIWI